ncbi:MAG: methyltransferase domain-containing protein [Gemmatimonadales bacterium]|nr:MAG: methyltransferase domain-containing protein [Gemmatimonadales bacterium]
MPPSLARREPDLVEWMDRPDCDPERLEATYGHFRWVNRRLGRWWTVYRRWVRPVLRREAGDHRGVEGCERGPVLRILDVGSGGGDIARALLHWGQADGFRVEVTGIDPDPRALRWARSSGTAPDEVGPRPDFRQAMASDLLQGGERFHVVVSNHVLHHLEDPEVRAFLSELEGLALRRVVVTDIERSPMGYQLFRVVSALPRFRDSYVRPDGLLSIRRSFRARELARVSPPGWTVRRLVPFRLVALRDVPREAASSLEAGSP